MKKRLWVGVLAFTVASLLTVNAIVSAHIVSAADFIGNQQFAKCIECGGRASIGMTTLACTRYAPTKNGSFILPNGVIVLVDEDRDDYENGSLEFYSSEEQTLQLD